ncbi:MAG: hypothetical protein PVG17_18060, partial [Desulfobacterales bacterium]
VSPEIYPDWLVARLRKRLKSGNKSWVRSSGILRLIKILTAIECSLRTIDKQVAKNKDKWVLMSRKICLNTQYYFYSGRLWEAVVMVLSLPGVVYHLQGQRVCST